LFHFHDYHALVRIMPLNRPPLLFCPISSGEMGTGILWSINVSNLTGLNIDVMKKAVR